ncbi:hypothetical protein ACIRG5_47355 [Lentzea sp. NPDC102401]|uniref:hypothetical protein n=1 Tax=Lentzea sp. NPDC102401 TaxID=3364128 RepID=UPI00381212F5
MGKNRRRQVARRQTEQQQEEPRRRRAVKWIVGAVLAAVAALVSAAFTGVFTQTVHPQGIGDEVRDLFRPGTDLRITLLNMGRPGGGWSAVLPTDVTLPSDEHTRPGPLLGWPEEMQKAWLDSGAFMLRGVVLQVEVEGLRNQEITLFNVRPLTKMEQMPLGHVVDFGSQGGDALRMVFSLDEVNPMARIVDEQSPKGRAFFEEKRIGLTDGHKESLSLAFMAMRAAYSFDIAFDYEIGGEKRTQILKRDGQPFRVAPSICASEDRDNKLTAEDRARFAGLRYRSAVRSNFNTIPYSIEAVPPEKFCG